MHFNKNMIRGPYSILNNNMGLIKVQRLMDIHCKYYNVVYNCETTRLLKGYEWILPAQLPILWTLTLEPLLVIQATSSWVM